jgi:hypothetical protein
MKLNPATILSIKNGEYEVADHRVMKKYSYVLWFGFILN